MAIDYLPTLGLNSPAYWTLGRLACANKGAGLIAKGKWHHTYRKSSCMLPLKVPHRPTTSSCHCRSACRYRRNCVQLYCSRRPKAVVTCRNIDDSSWTWSSSAGGFNFRFCSTYVLNIFTWIVITSRTLVFNMLYMCSKLAGM